MPTYAADWEAFLPPQKAQQDNDICDTVRQNATISPPQALVLESLIAGDTVAIAAEKATVHRSTIYRWLKDDDLFREAYFTRRADLVAAAQNRLLNLAQTAITSLERGLGERSNPWLAYAVLRHLGPLSPVESLDTEDHRVRSHFLKDLAPPPGLTIRIRPMSGGNVRAPEKTLP